MGRQTIYRYGWLTLLALLACLCLGWFMAFRLEAQQQPPQLAFADPAQYPGGAGTGGGLFASSGLVGTADFAGAVSGGR